MDSHVHRRARASPGCATPHARRALGRRRDGCREAMARIRNHRAPAPRRTRRSQQLDDVPGGGTVVCLPARLDDPSLDLPARGRPSRAGAWRARFALQQPEAVAVASRVGSTSSRPNSTPVSIDLPRDPGRSPTSGPRQRYDRPPLRRARRRRQANRARAASSRSWPTGRCRSSAETCCWSPAAARGSPPSARSPSRGPDGLTLAMIGRSRPETDDDLADEPQPARHRGHPVSLRSRRRDRGA